MQSNMIERSPENREACLKKGEQEREIQKQAFIEKENEINLRSELYNVRRRCDVTAAKVTKLKALLKKSVLLVDVVDKENRDLIQKVRQLEYNHNK